jgi:hypoxanthine phosphoribosyltransferase
MTTTLVGQQSITLTYQPDDGPPESLTFEGFIPEIVVYERLDSIAHLIGGLIAANPSSVIMSPIMSGATQTMDEMLALASHEYPEIGPEIKPIKLKRYHGASAGDALIVQQDLPDDGSIEGRIVIFVDEVVDEAVAAKYAADRARALKAQKVILVTLTNKPKAHKHDIEKAVDHFIVGFNVPNNFLVGWGMDWHDMGRWLRWIGRRQDGKKATYTTPRLPSLEDLLK